MDILSYSHAYYGCGHNAGAETTLHDLNRLVKGEGYNVEALVSKPHKDGSGPYVIDGITVQPHTSKLDPELWFPRVNLVLSHLECSLRSGMITKKYGINNGHLIHNDQSYCITAAERYANFLIHNTAWVKEKYDHTDLPSVIFHPPVEPSRYAIESSRQYITLVNLSDGTSDGLSYDKGPRTFYELAKRFPDEQFLGVKGAYGNQLVEHAKHLPNVTIWEHTNNILDVYRVSKVMLVPSKYESYGRVPVEAGCSGIPSIVTEGQPGLVEAMGYSAMYRYFNDHDGWENALSHVLEYYDDFSERVTARANENWKRTQLELPKLTALLDRMGDNGSYYDRRS